MTNPNHEPPPPIAMLIEACDGCNDAFVNTHLWRVTDHGLLCSKCIDHLRDLGLVA